MNPTSDLSFVTRVASHAPILTGDDETQLIRRFRESRDRRAADTLVRAHLRMVVGLAVKYRHYGIPVSELVAEGNCGLVVALERFDPERGVRFGTYAKHWVRAQILACVIRSASIVGGKTGVVRPQLFFRLRRERARVTALLGEGPAADEALAQRMSLSVEQLGSLLAALDMHCVSLDAPSETSERLLDTLASSDGPEEHYFHGQRHHAAASAVAAALGSLDARERFIAEHRFLAGPEGELSLVEVAKALGISRERARQLEGRAKQKLERSSAIHRNAPLLDWFAD
jgi:RNA polymerase sigma-32 factor